MLSPVYACGAENCLTGMTGAATETRVYDGDGNRVPRDPHICRAADHDGNADENANHYIHTDRYAISAARAPHRQWLP